MNWPPMKERFHFGSRREGTLAQQTWAGRDGCAPDLQVIVWLTRTKSRPYGPCFAGISRLFFQEPGDRSKAVEAHSDGRATGRLAVCVRRPITMGGKKNPK